MARRSGSVRAVLMATVLAGVTVLCTGCGYLRNVRDDLMDVGTLAAGVVPPVVPLEEGSEAVGFLPPSFGAYVQVTDFMHFGGLYKCTGDLEWDRRGIGATIDRRSKIGFGPLHCVSIRQTPVVANAYKIANNEMDGWRAHMADLADPIFGTPAKILVYESVDRESEPPYGPGEPRARLGYLSRGWQDWEFVQAEIAVPEPFLLHSGFYMRAGFDPSQIVDLALSIFCIDLYDDAAYTFWGDLKYGGQ
jgi:hypothetical protein